MAKNLSNMSDLFIGIAQDFGGLNIEGDSDAQLIIGLDFGTTYSGIAYTFTEQSKPDPESVTSWPGTPGQELPKTPTLIDYGAGDRKSFVWGSKVNPTSSSKVEGIKLLLDPDQPFPIYVPPPNAKKELNRIGKPPLEVASDYLRELFKHSLAYIGAKYSQDYIDMYQKKFVVTVPAVWSDKAKNLTLKAAKTAGIYPVQLIKEPEAAALYTLHYLKGRALSVGDAFVICDAGGGTVDLISYEVDNVDPLELKELVPGTGALAGSLMLNKRFAEVVKNIVGDEEFIELQKTEGYADALRAFDREAKPGFVGDEDQAWNINFSMANLQDDPSNNIMRNCLRLKHDLIHQIFEPLVTQIIQLVAEQVANIRIRRMGENHPKGKEVKAIFLVGGFGSSQYLKMRLTKANPDIQVIQPPDAWGAIAKGAVLSQMPREAVVTSTRSSLHYGVSANAIYKEYEDAGQPKIFDKYEQIYRVAKMTWYINYDEELIRDQRIEFTFFRKLPEDYTPSDLILTDELYQCAEIDAPKYPDRTIKPNVVLRTDLRNVSKDALERRTSVLGVPYYLLTYKLVVSTKTALLLFSSEVKGKEWGCVEAKY